MKVDYKIPIQAIVRSLQHYHRITVQTEEVNGADFFPSTVIGTSGDGATTNVLRFNPKMRVLLFLYNVALETASVTSEAIVHYALFQACMDTVHYPDARFHLDAFCRELDGTGLNQLSEEKRQEIEACLLMQQYFTLYHESFHLIWHHYPDLGDAAKERTRQLLLDIKTEYTDDLMLIDEEELYLHPRIRQQIASLIRKLSF